MKTFLPLFFVFLSACTTISYTETPVSDTLATKTLEVSRFGVETAIDGLSYTTPEGKSLNISGYTSDQTKAIAAAVNAAVSAAITGAKP